MSVGGAAVEKEKRDNDPNFLSWLTVGDRRAVLDLLKQDGGAEPEFIPEWVFAPSRHWWRRPDRLAALERAKHGVVALILAAGVAALLYWS